MVFNLSIYPEKAIQSCVLLDVFFTLILYIVININDFTDSRGHTVNAVCESFQGAKDAGFKVVAHMMPDLPNVGLERDIQQFKVHLFTSLFLPPSSFTHCYYERNSLKTLLSVPMV